MPKVIFRIIAIMAGVIAAGAAQNTYEWTGGADGNGRNLFGSGGYGNWSPALVDADVTGNHIFRIQSRNSGGPGAPIGGGLSLTVSGTNSLHGMVFSNATGHFPPVLTIAGNLGGTTSRRLVFAVGNTEVIRVQDNVAGAVAIGQTGTGNVGIRLPDAGVSTIHVGGDQATLDLRSLQDTDTNRGAIHAGSTDPAGERAMLRKTGGGALDLRTVDAEGNRMKGLIIEGGVVVIGKNPDMGWNPSSFMPGHVVLNGGILHFDGFGVNSGENRGFQLGAAGGTFHLTGASHALLAPVSDLPGEAGVLIKTGPTGLRLAVAGSYSGGSIVREGSLRYTVDGSFGSGPVRIEGGTITPMNDDPNAPVPVLPNSIEIGDGGAGFGGMTLPVLLGGDINLTGGVREIRISNPTTIHGVVSNGGFDLLADSSSLEMTLRGANTHAGGTTVTRGILRLEGSLGGTLTIGAEGALVMSGGILLDGTQIVMEGGRLVSLESSLVLTEGTNLSGNGIIMGDVFVGEGAMLSDPENRLIVLGRVSGPGHISGGAGLISPSTVVDGVETSVIGQRVFTQTLSTGGVLRDSDRALFRIDLGGEGVHDRVRFEGALFEFGTEGLDLRQFEFVTHNGFGDGVYQIISGTDWLSGSLGNETRGSVGGLPALLRIGNDGKSIELRVGSAADAFPFTAGETYFGRNNYIEYRAGNMPVILVSGHDGDIIPEEIPARTYGSTARDTNLHPTTRAMEAEIIARTGRQPHVIFSHLRRTRLDPNREIVEAAQGNPHAEQAWSEYHRSFIETARDAMEREHGFALTFDMHGHGHAIARLEIGYLLGSTELNVDDDTINMPGYAWQSSLRSLMLRSPSLPFSSLIRGPVSLGERFVESGVPAWPSETYPNIGDASFFSGGFTTSEHSCLDCNSPVEAIQIETHFGVRSNATNRAQFARDFCNVLQGYMTDFYQYSPGTASLFSLETASLLIQRGGAPVTITVRRDGHLAEAETMALAFSGSAVRGTDYVVSADAVDFLTAQAEATLTLTPAGAGPAQGDRRLTVALQPQYRQSTSGGPLDFTLGDGVSQTVRITAMKSKVGLADGSARFRLTRSQSGGSLEVPLDWSGSAIAGGHFDPVPTALFPAGTATLEVDVPLRNASYIEDHQTLTATLGAALGESPAFTPGLPSQAEVVLTDDDRPLALAVWLTDGLSGNVWRDRSGFDRHATTLPGGLGPSLVMSSTPEISFDGTSATAALPRFKADPDGAFSIAFFFRPDVGSLGGERNLLSYGERGSEGALGIYLSSASQLRTALGAAAPVTVSGNWNDGAWHHYALTVAADGTARIHIDGEHVATSNHWIAPLRENQLFWIGWRPGIRDTARFFKGAMRDFRIYQEVAPMSVVRSLAEESVSYESWLAGFGIDAGEAGNAYLQHYAFAVRPTGPAPSAPRFELSGDRFELEFSRQLRSSDLRYELQRSSDLGSTAWENVATLSPRAAEWNILLPGISIGEIHGRAFMIDNSAVEDAEPLRFYRIKSNLE
jgi:autotransporter-associated beta strand protein